jgi:hypothetical protein
MNDFLMVPSRPMVRDMTNRRAIAVSALVFGAGLAAGRGSVLEALADDKAKAAADPAVKVTFDNPRVTVKEITLVPGGKRLPRVRETDELVLFFAESHYQAIDAAGKKEPRDRAAGAVVWHKKGEQAPTLVNEGKAPVRYYSISIK